MPSTNTLRRIQQVQVFTIVWMTELDKFEREHGSSLPTRAGVASCRRALRSLYPLLSERNGSAEPDIRYLLQGDLLRVKGLALGENWEPGEADTNTFVRVILGILATDRFDWFDNLEDRCAEDEGDYEAANLAERVGVVSNHETLWYSSVGTRLIAQTLTRHLEQQNACRDRSVDRVATALHRDAHDVIGSLK